MSIGTKIYNLANDLFPVCRSLTGSGVRHTLSVLANVHPMAIYEIPTGTEVFDWTVPKEWNIEDAFILNGQGEKIVDFKKNNLHVVGYSTPVDSFFSLEELSPHLYSIPEKPDSIPYVTSYYKERWGFCITENLKKQLQPGQYRAVINSSLVDGSLTYGEIILKGETSEEVLLSTYICHPSMANNELSGPCLAVHLAAEIAKMANRKFTYRIVFVPETIGSIAYIHQNFEVLKKNVRAGFVLSCVGDNRTYSYMSSPYGNTLADKVLCNVLKYHYPNYKTYSFLQRGSDERQYCSPGVDLPVCGFSRSLYGMYPEYHTSDDDMSVISPQGLEGAFNVMVKCILALEGNKIYKTTSLCEPQLGKRNLYSTLSFCGSANSSLNMLHFLAYANGANDLIEISNIIEVPIDEINEFLPKLLETGLVVEV